MKLFVGLGNPDKKYQNTRHNIGMQFLDCIYEHWLCKENFSNWSENKKLNATLSEGSFDTEKIILAKPTTYMNESGNAVQKIMHYYKIEPKDVYIVHDDLDILIGNYKVQFDKSSAGHNGIKSIIANLGTQAFGRIRIGIGKTNKAEDTSNFVLQRFNILERHKLKQVCKNLLQLLQNDLKS